MLFCRRPLLRDADKIEGGSVGVISWRDADSERSADLAHAFVSARLADPHSMGLAFTKAVGAHLWCVARRPRTPSAGRTRSRVDASSASGSSSICSRTMIVLIPSCRARSACTRSDNASESWLTPQVPSGSSSICSI